AANKTICVCQHLIYRGGRAASRKFWVHPLTALHVPKGNFSVLYHELRRHPEKFSNYLRMSIATYDALLHLVGPCVTHNDTIMRRAVSAEERLCITIRYLATGQSFSALYYQFLVGRSTISCIVRETCTVIWEQLQPNVMPQPTEKSWLHIAEEYYGKTNFPNCLGALDGKHVRMIMPPNSGSKYWNYKKFFSLVLLAVVDANYCFTIIDVGAYGSSGDANAFKNSIFYKKLNAGRLQLPQPRPLPRTDGPPLPFVFIGDEAFGLSEHLMRPYPSNQRSIEKRVFNYRLSRARRMVECTFGIMSNKWRVFHSPIHLEPDFVEIIIKACCALHNFVRVRDGYQFEDTLSDLMQDVPWPTVRGPSHGIQVRDKFSNYFMSPDGAIPWQLSRI
uniref:DDE Tnp4 domain-containing protein n=1 Tax=Xenopus tropicalis TaxID=8364 RepID=A0A803K7W3_XENTR